MFVEVKNPWKGFWGWIDCIRDWAGVRKRTVEWIQAQLSARARHTASADGCSVPPLWRM